MSTPAPERQEPPPLPLFKPGRSLESYARGTINDKDTLLGDRFLNRGGSCIVVAPSGLGKSTLSIQVAILWSCGQPAFDIQPAKALRVLIVQSEDDEGDCIEMARMMDQLGLEEEHKEQVRINTELIHCNDLTGPQFAIALRQRLQSAEDDFNAFDLLLMNPYSGYLGGDVGDTDLNIKFLHGLINPILADFRIAIVPICHSPKTQNIQFNKFQPHDFQYTAAGCAAIANWTRAMIVILPVRNHPSLFRFIAAKRGARIGDAWEGQIERYFQHSTVPGLLRWDPASQDQKKAVSSEKAKAKKTFTTREVILQCLDLIEWRNRAQFRIAAKAILDLGINSADTYLSAACHENLVEQKKNGNEEKCFRRNGISSNGDH